MLHNSAFLTLTHTNPIVKLNFPETETIPCYYSRPGRMADDAFCPSWATPSIEPAIRAVNRIIQRLCKPVGQERSASVAPRLVLM